MEIKYFSGLAEIVMYDDMRVKEVPSWMGRDAMRAGLLCGFNYQILSREKLSTETMFEVMEAFGPPENRKRIKGHFNSRLFVASPGHLYPLTDEDINEVYEEFFPEYGEPTPQDRMAIFRIAAAIAKKNNCIPVSEKG